MSLAIPRGVIYGLLGPNGAGKTTLIRVLATLLRPDSGTALVAGYDVARNPAQVRDRIGLAGQFAAVDDHLAGRENITMIGRLYGLTRREAGTRANQIIERIHLAAAASTSPRASSGPGAVPRHPPGDLDGYHLYHATRAELLRELGHPDQARAADRRALELTANPAEQAVLQQRLTWT
ncbi:ATP-binding cassette domain-containing protein [Phytohabitans rumicis]|uniref:ABC transporter domain-containing protein n=1 Tax=Phytohabitans rumicis TaxID=1076125 RepID=A0A6V8LFU7_9ACTN|nr:ATP-binding cassette domain-containing protein [Phytohabitans rumicis]GFJ93489.1 hypothetical protein Prum_071310 [Phytohabitans rumicis]